MSDLKGGYLFPADLFKHSDPRKYKRSDNGYFVDPVMYKTLNNIHMAIQESPQTRELQRNGRHTHTLRIFGDLFAFWVFSDRQNGAITICFLR